MVLPNQQAVDYPNFRLLIVGDGGTGKTSLIKRLVTGDFERNYEPTIRAETHMLDFHTNRGKFRFTCMDVGAEDNHRQLHYINGECAIIMFDVTTILTYNNVPTWYRDLCRRCDDIPIVLCGNKVNSTMRHVQTNPFKFPRINCLSYFEISIKSNYNLEKPFLYLARELLRDDKVYFVKPPALFPPEVQINMTVQQQHETEIAGIANLPLPDDDDDDDFDFFHPYRFRV